MEGCGTWMSKGERVDASSTWEISVRKKKGEGNYHTTYWKASAKKIMRTVNVKGESEVNGGKCTTEKMSPRPRTVTLREYKVGTSGLYSTEWSYESAKMSQCETG